MEFFQLLHNEIRLSLRESGFASSDSELESRFRHRGASVSGPFVQTLKEIDIDCSNEHFRHAVTERFSATMQFVYGLFRFHGGSLSIAPEHVTDHNATQHLSGFLGLSADIPEGIFVLARNSQSRPRENKLSCDQSNSLSPNLRRNIQMIQCCEIKTNANIRHSVDCIVFVPARNPFGKETAKRC